VQKNAFNMCPMSWSSQVSSSLSSSSGPTIDLTLVLDRAYLTKVLESFLIFGAIFLLKSLLANLTTLLPLFTYFCTLF